MPPLFSQLWVLQFTFGSVFFYNSGMFLKFLYIVFLIIFFYLNVAFTAVVSFLKVTFFGL